MLEERQHTREFADPFFRSKRKSGSYKMVPAPILEATVADTHAHLQYVSDPVLAIARAAAYGMPILGLIVDAVEDGDVPLRALDGWMREAEALLPGMMAALDQEGNSAAGVAARPKLPDVRVNVGVHPHNAKDYTPEVEHALRVYLADQRVTAVGEIGLDYHYDLSERDVQRDVFARQIRLAHEAGMPVALHVREAHEDAFAIMESEGWPEAGTLLHCYTADWETLRPWVEKGCYVAFGGALTFGSGEAIRDAASHVPVAQLLTETDSPYMAPVPLRGSKCEPAQALFTAECLARVKGVEPGAERKAFLEQMVRNAYDFLDRPQTSWQRAQTQ